jgi:phasin
LLRRNIAIKFKLSKQIHGFFVGCAFSIAMQHSHHHIRLSAILRKTIRFRETNAMTENPNTTKAKTAKTLASEGTAFAEQGAAYTRNAYENTKVAAAETHRAFEQTYSAVAQGVAEFNQQWIEMIRANTNAAFDFSRQLVGVKSPSAFLELSAAHARKQFETFAEQSQQLAGLAQKVTTEAVQPLQAGVKSVFTKAA